MFLGHVILKFHPGFRRTTAWRNGCWDNTLLWTLSRVVFHFSPKFFYKMLTCAKLGATVNDEQSNPSDARRFSSKQTKKDYSFDFMYHAAPRSLRRSDRHAAAANFAQLLNHRLHLCDLSSLWIWTPKQSPGSAIQVVILHLFGQHKTFLLQWLLIQPRAWPTLCRDSSVPVPCSCTGHS